MLSEKSLHQIADAVAPAIADYITNDDTFFDTMCELIGAGLSDVLGDIDPEVGANVAVLVSERLRLVAI
jgi:hypothetical protein